MIKIRHPPFSNASTADAKFGHSWLFQCSSLTQEEEVLVVVLEEEAEEVLVVLLEAVLVDIKLFRGTVLKVWLYRVDL